LGGISAALGGETSIQDRQQIIVWVFITSMLLQSQEHATQNPSDEKSRRIWMPMKCN
jgi:hypothetical protein